MITSCPHCQSRFQILKSDLFEGPMRARCTHCSSIFALNEQDQSMRPLTLPPGCLISLEADEDVSKLDHGPEWVGDDLMGPLALLATEPPPVIRMASARFGSLAPKDETPVPTLPILAQPPSLWRRMLVWVGLAKPRMTPRR